MVLLCFLPKRFYRDYKPDEELKCPPETKCQNKDDEKDFSGFGIAGAIFGSIFGSIMDAFTETPATDLLSFSARVVKLYKLEPVKIGWRVVENLVDDHLRACCADQVAGSESGEQELGAIGRDGHDGAGLH